MMQPSRRPHHEPQQTLLDPAWELVRRVPGLCKSAEDKLAWLYCWTKSRRGRQRISISAGEIAADQGVTSDAGRQRIKNLIASGLVHLVGSDRYTGVYTIELAEPEQVMQARAIRWDGQLDLPFAADDQQAETNRVATSKAGADHAGDAPASRFRRLSAEEPPEVPPEEPRSTHLDLDLDSKNLSKTLTSTSTSDFSEAQVEVNGGPRQRRGSTGGSSAARRDDFAAELSRRRQQTGDRNEPPPPAVPIASALLQRFAAGPSPDEQQAKARALIETIVRRVNCENLRGNLYVKLAYAVVEGWVPQVELAGLLANLDKARREGRLRGPASSYFNNGAKYILRRHEETRS